MIILCMIIVSACSSTKHSNYYNVRRNLMILENYELPRNSPSNYSKGKIKKQLHKRNEKYLRKLKRRS